MKRLTITIFITAILLIFCTVAYAQSSENVFGGVSYSSPYGMELVQSTDTLLVFSSANKESTLSITAEYNTNAYFTDFYTKEAFFNAFDVTYTENNISEIISKTNKVNVSCKMIKESRDEITINGTTYYMYKADYSLSAKDITYGNFCLSVYSTAKNGRIYTMTLSEYSQRTFNPEPFLQTISFEPGEIKILINGEKLISDTSPAAIEGRTLIPIRAVAEKMGYTVEWVGSSSEAVLKSADRRIVFAIDSPIYSLNGEFYELDVPALAMNGRTYIPLRAAAEAMGAVVIWNSETNTAEISK